MPSVTLSDMSARVLTRLDNNSLLYTQAEITSAVNESVRVVNGIIGYLQGTISVPGFSRPNQVWYDVPLGILFPLRVQFERSYLEQSSVDNLGLTAPNWLTETTANTGSPVVHWAPCGLGMFAIHPADSIGGNDLQVTGIIEPTQLVSGTDVIQLPNEYSESIEEMTVVVLAFKEGSKIFQDALPLYQKFQNKMGKMQRFQVFRQPQQRAEMVQRR